MKRRIRQLAVALLLAAAACGQSSCETVITSAGAALKGPVTWVQPSAASNNARIYKCDAIGHCIYELVVTRPSFMPIRNTGAGVETNRDTNLDLRLEVGSAESSEMPVQDNSSVGGKVLPSELRNLRLQGLDPLSMPRTLPRMIETSGSQVWNSDGVKAL